MMNSKEKNCQCVMQRTLSLLQSCLEPGTGENRDF